MIASAKPLSRRQALMRVAGLALAVAPFGSPASAQTSAPGAPSKGYTAEQKSRLNAALRSLRSARAQAVAANLGSNLTSRMTKSIDAAIAETEMVLSGRVRSPA